MNKAIIVRPTNIPGSISGVQIPAFEVLLGGDFGNVQQKLTFYVKDTAEWNRHQSAETQLFSVSGAWSALGNDPHHFELSAPAPTGNIPVPANLTVPIVAFAFKQGAAQGDYYYFPLPVPVQVHKSGPADVTGFFEGESWELEIRDEDEGVVSPVFRILWNAHVIPQRFKDTLGATYDWHAGNNVTFYNDACGDANGGGSYFADLLAAINAAQKFIFIVDWSFHPTAMLAAGAYTATNTVGALLMNKAQAGLQVAILTWKHGFKPADPPNDNIGKLLGVIASAANIPVPPPGKILWRADYRDLSNSHHQKFVLVDDGAARAEMKVFYGGLDITKGRFDWPEHKIMADATTQHFWSAMQCDGESYDEWYNAEWGENGATIALPANTTVANFNAMCDAIPPRQPWHDVHALLTGPIAWDFAREFVARWRKVDSPRLGEGDTDANSIDTILQLFKGFFDRNNYVQQWEQRPPSVRPWAGQLLHSIVKEHWSDPWVNSDWSSHRQESLWRCPGGFERSIQDAYLSAIQRAERFIYIENQYFIGSGANWPAARPSVANSIPEALVSRVQDMIALGRDFHVYVLVPMMPEGNAVPGVFNGYPGIRALEWRTIGYMIKQVRDAAQAVGKTWEEYLTFCCLLHSDASGENTTPGAVNNWRTYDTTARTNLCRLNKRYMVYIHCKLMIVDDRYLILGSANANERSMAGDRDTEVCVSLWPANNRVEARCEAEIQDLRQRLLTEHMGAAPPNFQSPELPAFRNGFQTRAISNYRTLFRPKGGGQMQGHLVMLPFDVDNLGDARQAPSWFTNAEKIDNRHEYIIDSLRNHVQWTWRSELNSGVGNTAMGTVIE